MKMLAGVLSVLMASPSFAGSGIMLAPQGPVEVQAQDGSKLILSHRAEIAPGTEIHTGDASAAMVTLTDGSRLLLSPSARFKVGASDTNETTFELAAGKLKAYFAGAFSGRLKIKTPTAICAVRGTEFELSAEGEKGTNVTVAEGHLEVADNSGHKTVVTSEETLNVGARGMTEPPHMVSLHSEMAQAAARPFAVALENAKSQTRQMIEDLRNRELKANEAQLGKSVIDAFGNRVRLEEYLLRPAGNQFQVLFLNQAKSSFNWGNITETFNSTLPNDPSQFAPIVAGTFFNTSATVPSNYLTNITYFASNTVDSLKENVTLGSLQQINFAGYNGGTTLNMWYPSTMEHTQTLSGPGVPGGSRVQFDVKQDYNTTTPGNFTVQQYVVGPMGYSAAHPGVSCQANGTCMLVEGVINPSNTASVSSGGSLVGASSAYIVGGTAYSSLNTSGGTPTYPSGSNKADLLTTTTYGDGSTVSVEKFLVSNSGTVLDYSNPQNSSFSAPGNYNMEDVITSNLFQGRQINVVIAPEILAHTNKAGASAGTTTFQP